MYVYRNGVYCPESREGFTGIVHGFVKDYIVQISTIREAVSILYISRRALTNDALNSKENYINVQNGLLDIETMELLPHDPKVYSTIQLPLIYEPENVKTEVFDS